MNTDLQGADNRMKCLLHVLIVWGLLRYSDAFDITVPKTTLIGIHSQSIVLGCSFTINGGSSLEHIVITWQRTESNEVVHSYYYGKDQLSQQSEQYSGRTSLFPEEFKHGNVSLKLEGVRAEDAGQYMCFVSNTMGNAKKTILLRFAAYYKEPQLLVKLQPPSMTFILESQGYPEASVLWYCAEYKNVPLKPNISFAKSEDGLYSLQSILEVDNAKTYCNHIVEIQNYLVNQTITRKFSLLLSISERNVQDQNPCDTLAIVFGSCTLVLTAIIVLLLVICKQQHNRQRKKEEKMMSEAE
ncbi:CD276 antigen-like [Heptranchias perlo]|uniref:CD276 antigen-like n=1 Tax=Heptranchias perlo TaxID=212740 RepID=UPI0035597770